MTDLPASGFIRLAPDAPTVSFTSEEAIDAARSAYLDAKAALSETYILLGYLSSMLFDRHTTVNRARLKRMRNEARESINQALAVEAALTRSIEAIEGAKRRD